MKYTITIPDPCNQKWGEMTPTAQGAFCSSCKKEVMDLTGKSKAELGALIKKHGALCGKLKPEQLQRPIHVASKNYRAVSRQGLWLAISSFLAVTSPAIAHQIKPETIHLTPQRSGTALGWTKEASDSIAIKGQIIDNRGGIPSAFILLKGSHYGVQADLNGNFEIKIDVETLKTSPTLIISFIGYKTQEIKVDSETDFLEIVMKEEEGALLGEVIIIKKQNIFKRMGNLFRKKDKDACEKKTAS